MDLDKHTNVVKQRSMKWFQLCKEANVTGSTLYRSIGLDTLKKQNEYYKEFIQKKILLKISPEVQKRIDHVMENEVNCLTLKTLCYIY